MAAMAHARRGSLIARLPGRLHGLSSANEYENQTLSKVTGFTARCQVQVRGNDHLPLDKDAHFHYQSQKQSTILKFHELSDHIPS